MKAKENKQRKITDEEIKQDIDLINPDENTLDRG